MHVLITLLCLCRCPSACCDIFPTVEYAYTAIPTYPSGQIGFMLLSNTAQGTHWPCFASYPCASPHWGHCLA